MTDRRATTTLPSDTEITLSRVFDAPRRLVWEAMTQPQHIKRWWGRGNDLEVTLDFRPGGSYRYVEHAEDGTDYAFRGEIREIVPQERVVQTFEFEGMPGHIAVETMTLEDQDGKTLVVIRSSFSSTEDRDGMLSSGMEDGANASYDALDALLAELQR
ncbi:MAG TPA: SRPBCC family protein [Micromonosporaceae bacterium]